MKLRILVFICLISVFSCDYERTAGDLKITVGGIDKSTMDTIEIIINDADNETVFEEKYEITENTGNIFLIEGILFGSYAVRVEASDDTGNIVSQSEAEKFMLVEDDTTSITVNLEEK